MTVPAISVVVLSYNRPSMLDAALRSIFEQSMVPDEVLVVDNPSQASETVRSVVADHPGATLVALDANVGFAGGMNEGARRVRHEIVFLTEDDIVLERQCLERLVSTLASTPGAAMVAPVMLNRSAGTVRCAGGHVHLGRSFSLDVFTVARSDTAYPVTFAPGAALCAWRDEFTAIGGFRPEFFMYMEDCELCLRLIEQGRGILVDPGARVSHFEPPPGTTPPHIEFHKQKNLLSLYALHARPGLAARQWASCAADIVRLSGPERSMRARALAWNCRHLPGLLRDRWRRGPAIPPPVERSRDRAAA